MNSANSTSKLCAFLQKARLKAGLSQRDVATALGYKTAQVVSDWERGYRSIPANVLKKIAKLYGVSAEEFFHAVLEERTAILESKLRQTFGIK